MSGWVSLYVKLLGAGLRSRMQYRFNFAMTSLAAALIAAADFLMIAVVLLRFDHVRGWDIYEVGYLYAVVTLAKTCYRTISADLHYIERYLVTGELDALMVRPVPVLFALMTANVRLMPGELVQSTAVLSLSMGAMMAEGRLDGWAIPLTLLSAATGTAILFAIGLATATVGFWTTKVDDLQSFTEDASKAAGQYPLAVYPDWLKGVLLTVLPVGFVSYVPALYLLKGQLGLWTFAAAAAVAAVALFAALRFWRSGIRRYQSTGH
ncbi:ABC transporter permease [Paenibacillus sp.]|uniref:ABC transporter permease n=1 Tax=Paenibacillus sp. TaxID=58172 RepID=UPI002D617833|nr:ABC-2 family transporter protein [Paenibacillus sp.]HZG85769.1 ABC-2 family transporter protein [Paenibacillus sp.]